MSNIEPTEEQKQAAWDWMASPPPPADKTTADQLAEFLAEREAKLRKQLAFMEAGSLADYNAFAEALQKEDAYLAEINLINERLAEMREVDGRKSRMLYDRDVVIDTLRARIKELEAACGERLAKLGEAYEEAETGWLGDIKELEEREAQHLADIKALREVLNDGLNDPNDIGEEAARDAAEALLQRLAHYDVAKADAAAVDWQVWANGSCPEPGCSLANPHEQGAACVKPTAKGEATNE